MKLTEFDINRCRNSLVNQGITSPSLNEIGFEFLRELRNAMLAQSDWMAVSDRTMTQAQIDYRQALRDLPATADPQLDDQGNLTNVTWPTYE
jgi:hypothetical protein